jgi:hypothetical protein
VSEYKRKPNIRCAVCGKATYRRPGVLALNNGKAYCGQSCYGKACRKEIKCIVCGTLILAGANKKTCSRACANTNRAGIQYTGRQPKDIVVTLRRLKLRVLQNRGSHCERCGFSLTAILQVHHKDRNHSNNALNNLELLCPNCHATEHYAKK